MVNERDPDYRAASEQMMEAIRAHQTVAGLPAIDEAILTVMRQLPRHEFVPPERLSWAYEDTPLAIGLGQTISQPFIVALMTHLLNVRPEDTILEVGTGSGYQAAVLAGLVKQVYSVERLATLADLALKRLRRLGIANVTVGVGDGYQGWARHAPFDGIMVTAAAPEIPSALVQQLKAGGRLVIPVGYPRQIQELQVLEKDAEGAIRLHKIMPVAFVPLIANSVLGN